MISNFIDSISWKCLLGQQSKEIREVDDLYFWNVKSKKINYHFTTSRNMVESDLGNFDPNKEYSFHYLSEENINFLKKYSTLNKSKKKSCLILNQENFDLSGRKNHGLRNSLNKCKKIEKLLVIENNYRSLNDVAVFLEEWSNTLADKYFRDNSGKNLFFLKNNFHHNCINTFIYENDKLISLSILSKIDNSIHSSYVIGKALCKSYPGLSEYTDILSYKRAWEVGITQINLGQSEKGLIFYKEKFPNSETIYHYNGTFKIK